MKKYRVSYFDADRAFGYTSDGTTRRWFHASQFHRRVPGGPGPVVGELVRLENLRGNAIAVHRIAAPALRQGVVVQYDALKGWGFVEGDDGVRYFIHRKESPQPVRAGERIQFYAGFVEGKGPRACIVRSIP